MTLQRRLVPPAVVAVLLAACFSVDPGTIEIPANAIIYKIDPGLLRYTLTDTTANHQYFLTWLPKETYIGVNCLGLVPKSALDTTGTFVFAYAGPNTGRLERKDAGVTDTVVAYFLPAASVAQGSRGSYVVDSNGKLTLHWSDGTQTRYFDVNADIRLFGDTIRSMSDQRSNGDSVRIEWDVYWTFDNRC